MSEGGSNFKLGAKLDVREVAWLCHFLTSEGIDFEECALNSQVMRKQISDILNRRDIEEFEQAKSTQFIPEEDFRWIHDKDTRQVAWVLQRSMQSSNRLILPNAFMTLPLRQRIISIIDIWKADLSVKQRTVSRLKYEWAEHKLDDKLFTWFKGEHEQAKCSMAWDWIQKHQPTITRLAAPFWCYNDLIVFFDQAKVTSTEKKFIVTKIKQRWNTKAARQNSPHKKQYNFVLSNEVSTALDKLAQKHKVSRTKALEKLILNEADLGLYLDQ
jgi:hypothetical protein